MPRRCSICNPPRTPYGKKSGACSGCGKRIWWNPRSSRPEPVCRDCTRAREPVLDWCSGCGNLHDPHRYGAARTLQFCSLECMLAGRRNRETRPCGQCGQSYKPWRDVSKYCSHACYSEAITTSALPSHQVVIPLRPCDECGSLILSWHGRTLCSDECRRIRGSRSTSKAIKRKYREDPEFRDRMLSAGQNRRARGLGLDQITSPRTLVAFLVERDQGICGICEEDVEDTEGPMRPSIDHVIPLARGGRHEIANLQLAHYRCNLSKGARVPAKTPGFQSGLR